MKGDGGGCKRGKGRGLQKSDSGDMTEQSVCMDDEAFSL